MWEEETRVTFSMLGEKNDNGELRICNLLWYKPELQKACSSLQTEKAKYLALLHHKISQRSTVEFIMAQM
jgi:hypothetical protein